MSVFKKTILIIAGLFLIFISIPYATHDISKEQAMLNIIFGSIIVIFNYVLIYRRATTVYYVIDCEKVIERIEKKREGDHDG